MWCGPAPLRPFNSAIHPKGFRAFLDYANGQLGDWGIHWVDQILWWTEEKYPRHVYSTGDRHIKQDSTTAPDTQVVAFEFESFTATWEHRQLIVIATDPATAQFCPVHDIVLDWQSTAKQTAAGSGHLLDRARVPQSNTQCRA